MGTGPWPNPPTEAEQLQALMAAANGDNLFLSLYIFMSVSMGLSVCNDENTGDACILGVLVLIYIIIRSQFA